VIDAGQHLRDDQGVMLTEAAFERCLQLADLGAHPSAGETSQDLRVALSADERVEHVPAGLGQGLGGHRRELDACVLEHLVQPLGLAAAFLDHLLR
jgi:hypothetical protein